MIEWRAVSAVYILKRVSLQATRGECTRWHGGTRESCSLQAWTGGILQFQKNQVKYQDGRHLANAR